MTFTAQDASSRTESLRLNLGWKLAAGNCQQIPAKMRRTRPRNLRPETREYFQQSALTRTTIGKWAFRKMGNECALGIWRTDWNLTILPAPRWQPWKLSRANTVEASQTKRFRRHFTPSSRFLTHWILETGNSETRVIKRGPTSHGNLETGNPETGNWLIAARLRCR